jgi:two-component system, OmpR family, phosphate regulon sensor histidine kinase PhoR
MDWRPQRPLASLALLFVAALGTWLAGESLVALFIGAVAGAAAALIGWRAWFFPDPPARTDSRDGGREQWVRQVAEAMAEPTMLLEAGRILVANGAAKRLLGDWIEGQDVRLAMRHPVTVELLSRPAPIEGGVERVEVAGLGQAERRWLMTVSPLGDGSRLVSLTDRSEAVAAERMRVDFVANASHELRTPLATVLGFIETLQDDGAGGEPDIRNRFLALMHAEAKRMQQLIEDLMSLSRIEAERFSAPREEVDLMPLVDEIRAGCAHLLQQRRNRLVTECAEGVPTRVFGDHGQLLQLIRNLVVNAVKYGREGEDVTVAFEAGGDESVRMTVSDRGEGIPAEHLPRLTERFYRVDPGRSRALGGTGLGLAIVKHIVTRHRGGLEISSEAGRGTRVAVSLPSADGASHKTATIESHGSPGPALEGS